MLTKSAPFPFPNLGIQAPAKSLTHRSQSPPPCSLDLLLLEKDHPMALGGSSPVFPLSDLITVVSVRVCVGGMLFS